MIRVGEKEDLLYTALTWSEHGNRVVLRSQVVAPAHGR